MSLAYIGLGSNLDNPVAQVRQALDELARLPLSQRHGTSSLYATPPLGPQDQPDFINAVAALETSLSPLALLDQLQALEQRHRRQRRRHWGPRTLDLDLLLYDQQTLDLSRLRLPHLHMHERGFVLVPLHELAPHIMLHQRPLNDWLTDLDTSAIRRLADTDVTPVATI
ncbi:MULTISPECIES: 2-amino-4-hydroxy-6-hydroxymethyldihydropteridine diphosphokinase [unclassified Halomonas]|uniref:2-amino-4-hydroxy-6- hydroxymethyldihydropteridine diphosphokinase n=1 Tax=unclassified Halomonas TaxID=2609666 RepID=UPI0006D948EA|nr:MULTISPECIES: 2-amino-4-hydroxy-6-hydroxymethyldihydropteridine diphosphokinase [unclassified Halomonas]KPQ21884.1 MAG: 2-amino-4-hydroxy-6-hydroxymethyldihydropteridine diphosphokinase [Halomonas sp. HL-93]SBR51855.1 2-amino-4-hydroxy-6-hydroxymethyldihydropteridinediphosphokinase [Halomonas sp. HL-93]SNY97543.1 2-amino-4-hydroxy-6-hydroxymethyldihydropteridinediphosphokinase [Halomonas sp. hl-4]